MKLTQMPQIEGPGRPEGAGWELPSFKAPHRLGGGDEEISRAVLSTGLQNQLLILIFPCNSPPLSLPPSLSVFIKTIQKHESPSLAEVTSITAQLMPFPSSMLWSGHCFSLTSMEISPVSTHSLPASHYHTPCCMAASSLPLPKWVPWDLRHLQILTQQVCRGKLYHHHPSPFSLLNSLAG